MNPDMIRQKMQEFPWYHTVELAPGIVTSGQYDHRPLLEHYEIPDDLSGKTVIDVGPAHGFFAFEFEKRHAQRVVTVELEKWTDHDMSPDLEQKFLGEELNEKNQNYLNQALAFAIRARRSKVEQQAGNIYDLDPSSTGMFDISFCGSLLIHLTDPLRALYALRKITREYSIISTVIEHQGFKNKPVAHFVGKVDGQAFWIPNMSCLKDMARAAGFKKIKEVSTFNLISVDGEFNSLHGTIKAYV